MSQLTKIVVMQTMSAIWEYDPDLQDNCVLSGSLDVIAAICTLAIKVMSHPFVDVRVFSVLFLLGNGGDLHSAEH